MRAWLILAALSLMAAERTVDPTFLHRYLPDLQEQKSDVTTATCHYKPVFGAGDSQAGVPRSVARFGELAIDPGGSCGPVGYAAEEQVYVVLDGSGTVEYASQKLAVSKHDFIYMPVGLRYAMASATGAHVIIMGFRAPERVRKVLSLAPTIANMDDVKWQTVSGHPDSVLYQLLVGGVNSKRDKIAAGEVITSLFIMEFEPGGTNFPHHHDKAEEIYLVLDGSGDMVAGSGTDGVEGRHPARAGDAYFFRLNCTVGFYASRIGPKARILAVRSLYPFSKEVD
jgi:mannose-6-phosphate isomerase-like protein (cupin superfamily)